MTTCTSLLELDGTPHATPFPGEEPNTIRLTLEAGESVPAHTHPDREIVFYLIEGEIDLQVGETSLSLRRGDIARFGGDQEIAPTAIEDSIALIVLALRDES